MANIYVFLAEGFEEIEALTVVDLCRRVKLNVQTVSVSFDRMVTSARQITVCADMLLEEVDFEGADMLVLPGGMPGTKNLEENAYLIRKLQEFHISDKKIAAICAAPSILGHLGFLKGKKACVFPGFEEDLKDADVTGNEVETDGNIITSRGMGTAVAFGLTIVESFLGIEAAQELGKTIQYRK